MEERINAYRLRFGKDPEWAKDFVEKLKKNEDQQMDSFKNNDGPENPKIKKKLSLN